MGCRRTLSAHLLDGGFGFAKHVAVGGDRHHHLVDAVEFGEGFGAFVLRAEDLSDGDGGVAMFELVGGVVDAAVSGDRFGVVFEELAIDAAEDQLRLSLGTRVRIVRKGPRGRIEIAFESEGELIRLHEQLTNP